MDSFWLAVGIKEHTASHYFLDHILPSTFCKADILEHLKIPGVKLPAVAKQFNVPENTLREWTKVSHRACSYGSHSKYFAGGQDLFTDVLLSVSKGACSPGY
jgi:hypothetical protein